VLCILYVALPSGLLGGSIIFKGFIGNLLRYEPGSSQQKVKEERKNQQMVLVGHMPILRRNYILGASLFWRRIYFGKEDLILYHAQ
jgi:hypothetical protein